MISNDQHEHGSEQPLTEHRSLKVESLEDRNLLAADFDDSLSEARPLGLVSEQPMSVAADISDPTDVDIFRVTLASGQSIDIDVDTQANGPGGLGGYLRVFNEQGMQVAANNDAMGPDDSTLGFDPYIRFTAQQNGNYYIAVSNWENTSYDPVGGQGDIAGQQYATGAFTLTVKGVPQFDNDDAISEAITLGSAGPTRYSVDGMIESDVDVDMYRLDLMNGQDVEFDIDTPQNGPGGLGSYLTLFDANGNFVAANNDGAAPGETLGFDAYLRVSVALGGPYYLAVSNYGNTSFSPTTGNGDMSGSMYATGSYRLTIGEVLPGALANTTTDQAAPMIDSVQTPSSSNSLGASSAMVSQSTMAPEFASGMMSSPILNGSSIDANMQIDSQISRRVESQVFGPLDASPATSASLAALGTTNLSMNPGQPTLTDTTLSSRSALATDLALMDNL